MCIYVSKSHITKDKPALPVCFSSTTMHYFFKRDANKRLKSSCNEASARNCASTQEKAESHCDFYEF